MRFTAAIVVGMVFALSASAVSARNGNPHRDAVPSPEDPIAVWPDRKAVPASDARVLVNVAAQHVPAASRTRASLIVYAPDGTMLKTVRRDVRAGQATFRLSFKSVSAGSRQRGTYTVYATVEAGSQAFGVPTSFEITDD